MFHLDVDLGEKSWNLDQFLKKPCVQILFTRF
jgi:hypothetical protein